MEMESEMLSRGGNDFETGPFGRSGTSPAVLSYCEQRILARQGMANNPAEITS
jgi:hypothetical protein